MHEEVVQFGPAGALVGILSEMVSGHGQAGGTGLVLLNAGFIHRVGPYRLNVNLARTLADSGFAVLRFDLSGIGDSPMRHDNLPLARSAAEEARTAMDFLHQARGCERFVLLGLCSGAENAIRVACEDSRVVGVVCLNYQGDQSDEVITQRQTARYYLRTALFNPTSWSRALSGKSDYGAMFQHLGKRLRGQLTARPTPLPRARQLANELAELCERGVRLLLAYSEGDPGLDFLRYYLDREVDALLRSGLVQLQITPRANHMFGPLPAQQALVRLVNEWARSALRA